MVEAIAIIAGIFMFIWVIAIARQHKKESGPDYMGCIFCGMPCEIPVKKDEVKAAERVFGGDAVHVTVCPDCKDKR